MAGNIFSKEQTLVVLQNDNGASKANGVGVAVGTTLDCRSAGNLAENFWLNFELKAGYGSAPTIGLNEDFYLVPALDGTNFADVASSIPQSIYYVGSFIIALSQTAVQRMNILGVPVQPLLYTAYLVNNSGQTRSVNWGLRAVAAEGQYS